jgi:hypothetical protein
MQVERLHSLLSHNAGAVHYWLANCVLPSEMGQYSHRLAANVGAKTL